MMNCGVSHWPGVMRIGGSTWITADGPGEVRSAPGLAGEDGAGAAAWRLARHADRDPVRRRAFPDALCGAVDQGDAFPARLAYLDDQVVYWPAPLVKCSLRR
jgi:hypothetical protein